MNGRETPRCEFKVTVEIRWFLTAAEAGELLRAMAAAGTPNFFTSEEFNRVVDWIAREKAGGKRVGELLSADFNRRAAMALIPAVAPAEEEIRKLLRQIFEKSVEAVDRVQTP